MVQKISEHFQESSAGRVPAGLPKRMLPGGSRLNGQSSQVPNIPVGILPVYGTLPANVGHFSFGQESISPVNADNNFICFLYEVPDGRVIQASSFRVSVVDTYDAGGASTGVPRDLLTLSLFVNDASEPYNQGIKAQPFDGAYPCTIVAAPKNVIKIAVTYDYSAVPAAIDSVKFKADLFGDMLLQNDVQTENTALRLPIIPVRGA